MGWGARPRPSGVHSLKQLEWFMSVVLTMISSGSVFTLPSSDLPEGIYLSSQVEKELVPEYESQVLLRLKNLSGLGWWHGNWKFMALRTTQAAVLEIRIIVHEFSLEVCFLTWVICLCPSWVNLTSLSSLPYLLGLVTYGNTANTSREHLRTNTSKFALKQLLNFQLNI